MSENHKVVEACTDWLPLSFFFFWHWHGGVLLLKCFWTGGDGAAPSDQAEALVLLHGLSEAAAQDLFGLVAGHVQQVVAGVRHRQVVLLRRGGLDDDAQALHAMDGDAVAAGQEHCSWQRVSQSENVAAVI